MRGVIDVFVGQIKRDDLAAVCVKTNMQFAPGAAFRSSMFFEQPFAGSAQLQPRAVNDQVQVARSNPRPFGNRQSTRPSAQRRMIRDGQVDLQHSHDRANQPFALAQRQSKHRSQCQSRLNGEIGIVRLAARRGSGLRLPTSQRFVGEPNREASTIAKRCVTVTPVRHSMPLTWNVASALGMELNGTTDPRDGSVDHLSLNSLKDRHGPIRAPKSMAMTEGALAPLWLPLRETACRSRSTWTQFCALCLAEDRAPYFRRSWRLASRISCFRHGCGLRDRCPACRGGIAPFAQKELIPHYVCARCGFDLRGAVKISVEAAARRLERSIDDICKAEIAKGSLAIHEWVARPLRIPDVVGLGSGLPLANLPASARIRCFERLAQRAENGLIAAAGETVALRRQMAPTAGGRGGLIARFVDVVDGRQGSPRFAR